VTADPRLEITSKQTGRTQVQFLANRGDELTFIFRFYFIRRRNTTGIFLFRGSQVYSRHGVFLALNGGNNCTLPINNRQYSRFACKEKGPLSRAALWKQLKCILGLLAAAEDQQRSRTEASQRHTGRLWNCSNMHTSGHPRGRRSIDEWSRDRGRARCKLKQSA
jgi:hypothetical protein